METRTHPPNPQIMDAKELLHLRIEQANDKLLEALVAMTEGLFKVYQPEALEQNEDEVIGYQAGEPLSVADLKNKINIAESQIDQGEYLTPEELEKEAEEWLSESIG